MKAKYNNKKTTIELDGKLIKFDSIAESKRAIDLSLLQRAGVISELTFQPDFILQAAFRRKGVTHRQIKYISDFRYIENGKTVIEDVKSDATVTPLYQAKKKLFLYRYGEGILFKEVFRIKNRFVINEI